MEFYKALATKARVNLLNMPPFQAWKTLQGPYIPKFNFANPMFKFTLKDKKEKDLAQAQEAGICLRNKKPDTEHVRCYVTFECNISQKTVL